MLHIRKLAVRKGSKQKLAWTTLAEEAFKALKRTLLRTFGLFLINLDKEFLLRTGASDFALGSVLQPVREDCFPRPSGFWEWSLGGGATTHLDCRGKGDVWPNLRST